MYKLNDLTIIIPSNIINIDKKWIIQINNFALLGIKVIISIPPGIIIKEVYKKGFINKIKIINSKNRGQVKQRYIAYKYCNSELIMHMDDDIILDIKELNNLIKEFSLLPKKSCLAPYLYKSSKQIKNKNLFRQLKDTILFFSIKRKPGTIGLSSFPIPFERINGSKFTEVEWIPGGLLLLRKEDTIPFDFFNLPGKAYCEDLIHSQLLKNKGISLFISNNCSYSTEISHYKDLSFSLFFSYIKNDFIARNSFRRIVKNPLFPMLNAYFFIINYYLFYNFIKLLFINFKLPKIFFMIKKQ